MGALAIRWADCDLSEGWEGRNHNLFLGCHHGRFLGRENAVVEGGGRRGRQSVRAAVGEDAVGKRCAGQGRRGRGCRGRGRRGRGRRGRGRCGRGLRSARTRWATGAAGSRARGASARKGRSRCLRNERERHGRGCGAGRHGRRQGRDEGGGREDTEAAKDPPTLGTGRPAPPRPRCPALPVEQGRGTVPVGAGRILSSHPLGRRPKSSKGVVVARRGMLSSLPRLGLDHKNAEDRGGWPTKRIRTARGHFSVPRQRRSDNQPTVIEGRTLESYAMWAAVGEGCGR
jgi:hypothetical protein